MMGQLYWVAWTNNRYRFLGNQRFYHQMCGSVDPLHPGRYYRTLGNNLSLHSVCHTLGDSYTLLVCIQHFQFEGCTHISLCIVSHPKMSAQLDNIGLCKCSHTFSQVCIHLHCGQNLHCTGSLPHMAVCTCLGHLDQHKRGHRQCHRHHNACWLDSKLLEGLNREKRENVNIWYINIFCFHGTLVININTFTVAPNGTIFFATDLIFITFQGFTWEHSGFAEAFLFTLSPNDCLTRLQNILKELMIFWWER